MNEDQLLEILEKASEMKLDKTINILASTQNISIIVEGIDHLAADIVLYMSVELLGKKVNLNTPLEYTRYTLPYFERKEKAIILCKGGKNLSQQTKNLIQICNILGIGFSLITIGQLEEDIERICSPIELIELDTKIDELEHVYFTAVLIILTKIIAETAKREKKSYRAKEILKRIKAMTQKREFDYKEIRRIIKNIGIGKPIHIFIERVLYGLGLKFCKDLKKIMKCQCDVYTFNEYLNVLNEVEEDSTNIIISGEVEADIARQILNSLKMSGKDGNLYVIKGDPLLAPIEFCIPLFSEISKIIRVQEI